MFCFSGSQAAPTPVVVPNIDEGATHVVEDPTPTKAKV